METIIQLSDFHIKLSSGPPKENSTFSSLVNFLKNQNFKNVILVYNGDVIDSKSIADAIPENLPQWEKSEIWKAEAAKAFDLAKEYFSYLTKELSIPNDKIIICCGNHDVNKYVSGEDELICSYRKVEYSKDRFSLFCDFMEKVSLTGGVYTHYIRTIGCLNFFVLNTHWVDKSRFKLCFDCNSVKNTINENIIILENTKSTLGKQYNVFVAHTPQTDYCETGWYPYKENGYNSVNESIGTFFGLKLYGDKHTSNIHNYDYIVGAPLDSDYITYGLHQFNDLGQYSHRSLLYKDEKWQIISSIDDIDDLLEISKNSLKEHALKFLFGSDKTNNLVDKIKNFEKVRSTDAWDNLDRLFRSCATLQQPQEGMAGKIIDTKDGIINTLSRLLLESRKPVSAVIRGEARLGKSMFMTVIYLNLLYRFASGTFSYMPIYINLEKIREEFPSTDNIDSIKFAKILRESVSNWLQKADSLAKQKNCFVCCIIDGLNQNVFYENARVEQIVNEEINSKKYSSLAHYIYCLDTDCSLQLPFTPQHTEKNADYLVYFNRIRSNMVNSSTKYENFINSFCALNNFTTNETKNIMQNILKLNILEVDLNLLIAFGKYLRQTEVGEFFGLLDNFAKEKLGNANVELAAKASYYLYIRGKSYTSIAKIIGKRKFNYTVFEIIRTQKKIAQYLLAVNYVRCIQSFREDNINDDLNYLYGHDICTYIRGYIMKENLHGKVLAFAEKYYKVLSYAGKSTISFLIGRIDIDSAKACGVLKHEEEILQEFKPNNPTAEQTYLFCVAKRSIYLSLIATADEQEKNRLVEEYIGILLSNKQERRINRDFYLQFYGDRTESELISGKDIIFEGFDIYNTFHLLASRMKDCLAYKRNRILLPLELFTLCDLLQIRIDNCKAKRRTSSEQVDSFFYNCRYSGADSTANNVLQSLLEIICMYRHNFSFVDKDSLFSQYLYYQEERFKKLQKLVISGKVPDSNEIAFRAQDLLMHLSQLEHAKKIGWNIEEKTSHLSQEEYTTILNNTPTYESVLEHVYESYLIGFLYLPQYSLTNKKYDKQDVLKTIMIHDMGEAYTGDYPPSYVDYELKKKEESVYCKKLFLSGLHANVSDLTDCLRLWLDWDNPNTENYNIKVAKDVDHIQMLYKLFILLQAGNAKFSCDRVADFWKSANKIQTAEGKQIFNLIIASNVRFVQIAQTYNINIHNI